MCCNENESASKSHLFEEKPWREIAQDLKKRLGEQQKKNKELRKLLKKHVKHVHAKETVFLRH